jgi:hypothetical protein
VISKKTARLRRPCCFFALFDVIPDPGDDGLPASTAIAGYQIDFDVFLFSPLIIFPVVVLCIFR